MKNNLLLLLAVLCINVFYGQSLSELNPGISYQALLLQPEDQIPGYNNQDAPLTDTTICLLFSITSVNGSIEYQEQNNYLQIDLE